MRESPRTNQRRIRRVQRHCERGDQRVARGDLPGATRAYQRAFALVRQLVADEPANPDHAEQLGSLGYTLGELHLQGQATAAAIEALTEAGTAYENLAASATSADRQWSLRFRSADVQVRRGRAHALAHHPASALTDAQQAVMTYLEAPGSGIGDPAAARVLSWAAQVQLACGDPDLSVAAADWAVRSYLQAFRTGSSFALPAEHAPSFVAAVQTGVLVHTASGRTELAREAVGLLASVPGAPAPAPDAAQLRETAGAVTLAQALGSLDPQLARELTAPATDITMLVPVMRASPDSAASYGARLAELAITEFERGSPAAVRLALEAHALFAAASRARTADMRHGFATFGAVWARLLLAAAQSAASQQQQAVAGDWSGWLTGVVQQLLPLAIADTGLRDLATRCLQWQEKFYRAVGDRDAASRCAKVAAEFGAAAAGDHDAGRKPPAQARRAQLPVAQFDRARAAAEEGTTTNPADAGERQVLSAWPGAECVDLAAEAVARRRELAAEDPVNQQPLLALAMALQAHVLLGHGSVDEAATIAEQAATTLMQQSVDPARIQPSLVLALDAAAMAHSRHGNHLKADRFWRQATEILRQLAARDSWYQDALRGHDHGTPGRR